MLANKGDKLPTETATIIQAAIMGFSPQQVLLRDRLAVFMEGAPIEEVDDFVRHLGPQLAADWMDDIRQAEDQDEALARLLMDEAEEVFPQS